MRKYGKLIFLWAVIISTLLIYKLTYQQGYNYVALGDSLAVGMNPYGEENYGYSDYVKDYLNDKGLLKSYVDDFATSGYTINALKDDIKYNKRVNINADEVSIRKILRESDIVTISIGVKDFLEMFNVKTFNYKVIERITSNKNLYLQKIDIISNELNELIVEIKKYAKNDIVLLGYYNPLPYLTSYKNELDDLVEYSNSKFAEICEENNIHYVDIFDALDGKLIYFSNPSDMHPNSYGYKAISKGIIEMIEDNIVN